MKTKLLIPFTIFLVVISLVLSIKKNKSIQSALSLLNENEIILKDKEEILNALKETYLQNVFLGELPINGTFLGFNNTEVSVKDVLRPDQNVVFFVSDSACLDCYREYISLLFQYFSKEAVIIRLGQLLDNQEFLTYRIWGMIGFSELEKIVNSKKSLVALVNNEHNLQYLFLTYDSDLDLFEKYLVSLRNELDNHH